MKAWNTENIQFTRRDILFVVIGFSIFIAFGLSNIKNDQIRIIYRIDVCCLPVLSGSGKNFFHTELFPLLKKYSLKGMEYTVKEYSRNTIKNNFEKERMVFELLINNDQNFILSEAQKDGLKNILDRNLPKILMRKKEMLATQLSFDVEIYKSYIDLFKTISQCVLKNKVMDRNCKLNSDNSYLDKIAILNSVLDSKHNYNRSIANLKQTHINLKRLERFQQSNLTVKVLEEKIFRPVNVSYQLLLIAISSLILSFGMLILKKYIFDK